MADATLQVFRGTQKESRYEEYAVPVYEGMVVLDAIHYIQAKHANDLACRWNCKAGKCGSCSAEVNGKPRLMCMTRMDQYPQGQPIRVEPMRRFPLVRDLVTDVSWNYDVNKRIQPFAPKPREADGTYRMQQYDIDRLQEFHKCIECFLCQDVCHVLRDQGKQDFAGPRFMVRIASLAMHPLDTANRLGELKDAFGIGLCNITKCCTEVCPEDIHSTDNAIIPLKERVAGAFYDPLAWLFRMVRGT
jgi:succinate dehydrogenase / fumarate reductase iron-sulfur subunit